MTIGCADADRVGARPYRRHADTFLPHADTPTRSPVTLGQRAEKK